MVGENENIKIFRENMSVGFRMYILSHRCLFRYIIFIRYYAPKIVAKQYLAHLTNVEDKNDCKRLLKALNIYTEEENFTNLEFIEKLEGKTYESKY